MEKVLYVSTGGTIGFSPTPDTPRTEADYNKDAHTPYFIGKIAAEKEAFAIGEREKLPVTAINPGLILGPRFWKASESTRQVLDFLNNGMPVYFDGGFGVVDVEDVATGALLAMDRGGDRERYIVSGENVTVKHLLGLVAEMAGISPRGGQAAGAGPARHRHRASRPSAGSPGGARSSTATRWTSSRACTASSTRARRSASSASRAGTHARPSGGPLPGRSTTASWPRRGNAPCSPTRLCAAPTSHGARASASRRAVRQPSPWS